MTLTYFQCASEIPNDALLFDFAEIEIILKSHANIHITHKRFSFNFIDSDICCAGAMTLELKNSGSELPVQNLGCPAIIVLGCGFSVIMDAGMYMDETVKAVEEGYDVLIVNVTA